MPDTEFQQYKSLFRSALERYNEEQITTDSEEEEDEENPEPDVLI